MYMNVTKPGFPFPTVCIYILVEMQEEFHTEECGANKKWGGGVSHTPTNQPMDE